MTTTLLLMISLFAKMFKFKTNKKIRNMISNIRTFVYLSFSNYNDQICKYYFITNCAFNINDRTKMGTIKVLLDLFPYVSACL